MNRTIKTILMVLFFVVFSSPIKVSAVEPTLVHPVGIVVDIGECDNSSVSESDYFVDVIVLRDLFTDDISTNVNVSYTIPVELTSSEYADPENDWMSLSLFVDVSDFLNEPCRTTFYDYAYDLSDIPFEHYRVVVYEDGEDPVISEIYNTVDLATLQHKFGLKHIYSPSTQIFTSEEFETEYYSSPANGISIIFGILATVVLLVIGFVLVLLESGIFLIARQGRYAVLIPVPFNFAAMAIMFLMQGDLIQSFAPFGIIVGMMLVLSLFIGKIIILHKYAYNTFIVSILFSGIYYLIYIIYGILIS